MNYSYLRDDKERLYVSREEEIRGFANIEEYIAAFIQGLKEKKSKIKLDTKKSVRRISTEIN